MSEFIYKGDKLKEISFPLGGIGTGSIGLGGDGRLIDWEIFNRPHKGSINGYSHFAVKAETEQELLDARVLNGELAPPYTGAYNRGHFESYGFGPHRGTMAGAPNFKEVVFKGEYPFATLDFRDDKFPGNISMKAFNPFIPLKADDSSIPGAFFEIEIENNTDKLITYSLALSLTNPHSQSINNYLQEDDINIIKLDTEKYDNNQADYGNLAIATDHDQVSFQEYWYRGNWFDDLEIFWQNFTHPGSLDNRSYDNPGDKDSATLCSHIKLKPGKKKRIKYIISWNFPNMHNYWNPECDQSDCCTDKKEDINTWKNYYATRFEDSRESAVYSLKNWDSLYLQTEKFKNALYSSTIPETALEALTANISILKSPTCLRLEDGTFYGFEGCHTDSGCCEGSCTHVWNYAYALPFLFPGLERSMRDIDYKYNQAEDGKMSFRLQLPLDRERSRFRACADGQFGGVIKSYREWKISGDTEWLKSNWEKIKKSIEYAWSDTNEDKWDLNQDGVLEGRQHHTLDMELFGPNSWLTGFYLAALKAGAEMATYLGEDETAEKYRKIFQQGKEWADENLFNGEYYHQLIDLTDKNILEKFKGGEVLQGDNYINTYWNEETEEVKYQIGEGCGIDQVLAQWHANLCGLGEIYDQEQTIQSLQSIYKYNFKTGMRDFFNPCRLYSLNEERGLVICDWPEDKYRPAVPLTYAQETMNGFEYQAAIHMIQEGMIDQGMNVIKGIRDRYDGEKRNPWNEFECGSNYARSMASYALLPTFSGFTFDMVDNRIGFDPINLDDLEANFKYFWSLGTGWGIVESIDNIIKLKVLYGSLTVKSLILPFINFAEIKEISKQADSLDFTRGEDKGEIRLNQAVVLNQEQELILKI
ncbi:MAG: GH116 family glycosyl-hydrolase [Halanaerobiaceae bacterium]